MRRADGVGQHHHGRLRRGDAGRHSHGNAGRGQEAGKTHRPDPGANGKNGARNEQPTGAVQDGRTDLWPGRPQPGAGQGLPRQAPGKQVCRPIPQAAPARCPRRV